MKKFITLALLICSISSSFAGTLVNKKTGESIIFQLNVDTSEIEITSRTAGVKNRIIPLEKINKKDIEYDYALMAVTDLWFEELEYATDGDAIAAAYIPFPFLLPVTLGAHVIDILILPVKGTVRLIKNSRNTKNYKALLKSIASEEEVKVSNKRFKDIKEILQDV